MNINEKNIEFFLKIEEFLFILLDYIKLIKKIPLLILDYRNNFNTDVHRFIAKTLNKSI